MTTVTIHQAKTQFSRLVDRALAGEEVVVMRGNVPVVVLKPVASARNKRRLGGLRGLVTHMAADFDATPPDFVLAAPPA